MKLFSPKIAKLAHNGKRDEDISQIAFLTVTLKKLQDSINLENTNFDKRMVEQRELYTNEKIKLQGEVKELEQKLQIGEKRLMELLIPIDGLKEQAENALENALSKAKSLVAREEEVSEKEELLADKLDSLGERELKISDAEMKIESRLTGIAEESKLISDSHKLLNAEKRLFLEESVPKIKFIREEEERLKIIEKRNREYLDLRIKELDEKEKSLKDRREALEREFTRLNNKK